MWATADWGAYCVSPTVWRVEVLYALTRHDISGISATVCAFETLHLRGYDVAAVALLDAGLGNQDAIARHLPRGLPIFALPAAPAAHFEGDALMPRLDSHVTAWLDAAEPVAKSLATNLHDWHASRLAALRLAPTQAHQALWWPFTQHEAVQPSDVCVIDARAGDAMLVHDDVQVRARS